MKQSLVHATQSLLEDAKFYLERISATDYCQPLPRLSGATVGQHTCQLVEHFLCILEKFHDGKPSGDLVVSYDQRRRDLLLETSPRHALAVLDVLAEQAPKLRCDQTMWLAHTDPFTGEACLLPTSLEREMLANIEHGVHLFSLIKIGLAIVEPGLGLPPHFGVSASPAQHRQEVAWREPALTGAAF